MVSLASIHSVFFTIFSTKSFNYILYLGTLKQTEVNPAKSSHLVKDWVEAMPLSSIVLCCTLWGKLLALELQELVLLKKVMNSLKSIKIFGIGVIVPGWIQPFSSSVIRKDYLPSSCLNLPEAFCLQ